MKNEPAFPVGEDVLLHRVAVKDLHKYTGLTKREYFAGLAMQGMLSADSDLFGKDSSELAFYAVGQADALLLELEKSDER